MNEGNKYIKQILEAKSEKELFDIWKTKSPIKCGYFKGKKEFCFLLKKFIMAIKTNRFL